MNRLPSIATAIVAAGLLAASAANAATLPASGSGLAGDGEGRVAVFAPDGASVGLYNAVRRRAIGVPVAIPRTAAGAPYRARTVRSWGTTVFLAAFDPARPSDLARDDRLALADVPD
ncbi:hypothetical protein [Patulibacter medicamentivorans]|uniref:hypothetical protein n=1 Tax=Patulibacter medicamentivorans TaxID=1097667 RepID=UPI001110CB30|nr:hypothetical protein [Patulibacter medicamentivorans]